jgi:hypothetical protein
MPCASLLLQYRTVLLYSYGFCSYLETLLYQLFWKKKCEISSRLPFSSDFGPSNTLIFLFPVLDCFEQDMFHTFTNRTSSNKTFSVHRISLSEVLLDYRLLKLETFTWRIQYTISTCFPLAISGDCPGALTAMTATSADSEDTKGSNTSV